MDDEVDVLDTSEVVAEVGREIKRFGADVKELRDGVTKRIDALGARQDDLEKKMNRSRVGGGIVDGQGLPLADRQAELKAIRHLLKTGEESALRELAANFTSAEAKAMSVGSDPDGGYWVLPVMSSGMTKRLYDATPLRQMSRVITITAGDAFEEPLDIGQPGAGWVTETEPRPPTSTPQIGILRVPVNELYAEQPVTQRLLDDSGFDVETWLNDKVADRFARMEGAAFVTGTGIKQPFGFLTAPQSLSTDFSRPWGTLQTVATGNALLITADGLRALLWSVRTPYRTPDSAWLMSSNTASQIDTLKDTTGQYLWRNAMTAGAPDSLLGFPVKFSEDMPAVGAGSTPIAFGNWKLGYTIVDKAGIKFLRDPFTAKPSVLMYFYRRVGGNVANTEAIKLQVVST